MTQIVVNELHQAFVDTIGLLRDSIRNFKDDAWRVGPTFFQVPAKVAYHDVECLDFYFKTKSRDEWVWGYRFGKPWWELSNEEQPSQEELVAYLDELEERIAVHFAEAQDETLGEIHDPEGEPVRTQIGHYLYALRHTTHHLGSLVSLAASGGTKPGEWR
jgi:uncharacterized damage-inducible protein DinB